MTRRYAAFIGSGAIAREHLFAIQFLKDIDVAAVCDLSPARAESTAEQFAVPRWYDNHVAMLEEIEADFVHITAPPHVHFPLSRDCLEKGFNVLCEKPICGSVAELEKLKEIADRNGVLILENQNYRFHSSVQKIRDMVNNDDLGEIVEVQVQVHVDIHAKGGIFNDKNVPHYSATMPGGVAGDFLTHMTYIAQIFMGNTLEPVSLWQQAKPDTDMGQDEFRALLRGENALGYLAFSGNAGPAGFWLQVIGTKGQAIANLFEPPRIAVRKIRKGAAPLATLADGISEARAIRRSSLSALYRKFSGAARYDGLEEFLGSLYASLDAPEKAPLDYADVKAGVGLVETFCKQREAT